MLKIFPRAISGALTPASLDTSLFSALALASVSDSETEILYKGLSDGAMCVVNVIEGLGAEVKVTKEKISITPTKEIPDFLHVNFTESAKAFFMLVPFIKAHVSTLVAEHFVWGEEFSELISRLTQCGCKSDGIPLEISGKLSKRSIKAPDSKNVADGFLLCEMCDGSESVKRALDFFKEKKSKIFPAERDVLYLSFFVMAADFIITDAEIPEALKPFVKSERLDSGWRHEARLETFIADAAALGEYLLPAILLASRTGGVCKFENYVRPRDFHSRLLQMTGDLGIKCYADRSKTLIVDSSSPIQAKRVRAWQDENFVICATLCALHSGSETTVDSERSIFTKYPTFFDDLLSLGGEIQKL